MRVHLDERPFKCQLCSYRSRDSSQLTVHLRTHTNDRPFACPFEPCTTAFKTNSDLKRHLKLHICSRCDFKSGSQLELKNHQISCLEFVEDPLKDKQALIATPKVKQFECDYCDFVGNSKLTLTRHRREKHVNVSTDGIKEEDGGGSSKAKKTKVKKVKKSVLKREAAKHVKIESFAVNYCCNICNRSFVREDSYNSHLRQHQKQVEKSEEIKSTSATEILSLTDNSVQYLLLPTSSQVLYQMK